MSALCATSPRLTSLSPSIGEGDVGFGGRGGVGTFPWSFFGFFSLFGFFIAIA